jgi:Lipid desaturase domain
MSFATRPCARIGAILTAHRPRELAGAALFGITLSAVEGTAFYLRGPVLALWLLFSLPIAVALADFIVGLVHALGDHFELAGPVGHHRCPAGVLRESWLATFSAGDVPYYLSGVLLLVWAASWLAPTAAAFAGVVIAITAFANVIHRFQHYNTRIRSLPRIIDCLYRRRLLVDRAYHMAHHRPPHDRNFCVLTGWSEGLVAAIMGSVNRRWPKRG